MFHLHVIHFISCSYNKCIKLQKTVDFTLDDQYTQVQRNRRQPLEKMLCTTNRSTNRNNFLFAQFICNCFPYIRICSIYENRRNNRPTPPTQRLRLVCQMKTGEMYAFIANQNCENKISTAEIRNFYNERRIRFMFNTIEYETPCS